MTGYQLTKAFYAEVEQNEAMQRDCTAHHHSLYTWICELRNQVNREILDLPRNYTMQMSFIGSPSKFKQCLDDLAAWGIIEILTGGKKTNQYSSTKVRLAGSFLNKQETRAESARSEMNQQGTSPESAGSFSNQQGTSGEPAVNTTKIDKTSKPEKKENIYTEPASPKKADALDESEKNISLEAEPSEEETHSPPQPPHAPVAQPATGRPSASGSTPTPAPTTADQTQPAPNATTPPAMNTLVRHNGNGQMIKPDLPTLTAFMLEKGGTPAMAETMFDFYASKGWLVGKSPMKDWNAAARKWIRENPPTTSPGNRSGPGFNANSPKPSTTAPMPTHQTKIR